VCPAVRSELLEIGGPAPIVGNTANANGSDGFERRGSWHLSPPVNGVPLIVDIGYTINGTVYLGAGAPGGAIPTNGSGLASEVNFDAYASAFHSGGTYLPDFPCNSVFVGSASWQAPLIHKTTDFRQSSNTVLVTDGSAWNFMIARASRVTGQRHGSYNANPPAQWLWSGDQTAGYVVNFTGTTNILFLDGHVDGLPRSALPAAMAQFGGYRDEMVNIAGTAQKLDQTIIWNIKQQPSQ
jgi:prepilin-type processing-associated H-X9-DG protein